MTSALAFRHEAGSSAASGLPLVVALHARGGDAGAGLALARRAFGPDVEVLAPQAARPCNPFQSDLRTAPSYAGFTWYLGENAERPEAASFGDALSQLAGFVEERAHGRTVLAVGEGQGAVLALVLAALAPGVVGGALAVGAGWPRLPGWEPAPPVPGRARIALLGVEGDTAAATRAFFEGLGSTVSDLGDGAAASSCRSTTDRWLRGFAETSRNGVHAG